MYRVTPRTWVIGAYASALVPLLLAPPAMADDAKKRAYGQHLSRECTTCHRIDGTDNGIPSIIGWPAEDFVTTLRYYKEGLRPNAAMQSVAQSLEDDEFQALAMFFGALPKPPQKKP